MERVIEYLDLPQEPPTIIESNRPPAYWPSSSNKDSLVVVENLVIKYAPDLPPVLQDISFTLKAGERIGLLGRTGLYSTNQCRMLSDLFIYLGSGKSTLAMSILRFVRQLIYSIYNIDDSHQRMTLGGPRQRPNSNRWD